MYKFELKAQSERLKAKKRKASEKLFAFSLRL
jgi:hypothetical protein